MDGGIPPETEHRCAKGSFYMTKLTILTKFASIWSIWSIWSHKIFEKVVMTLHYLHYLNFGCTKVQKVHIFIKSCKLNLPEKEEKGGVGQTHGKKHGWRDLPETEHDYA